MSSAPRTENTTERPVFIVGMPRSGTSLVEQILSCHPDIAGGGELDAIQLAVDSLNRNSDDCKIYPECIDVSHLEVIAEKYLEELDLISANSPRVTDKMPHNFQHLGLIELLFPRARVIHCVRDPRDTCLSCYFQDFGLRHQYSTNLRLLGEYYKSYWKLMEHWKKILNIKFMEINYEDLVTDQEKCSRSMVEFCGLEWNDQCLRFHESERIVTTASYDQVRREMYNSSIGRWKKYETHVCELLDALGGLVEGKH